MHEAEVQFDARLLCSSISISELFTLAELSLVAVPKLFANICTGTGGGGGFAKSSSDEVISHCLAVSTTRLISLCTRLLLRASGARDLGGIVICKFTTSLG